MLIALAERQQDWSKTERFLQELQKLAGDTVEQRLAQSRYFAQRGGPKAIDGLQKLAENVDRFTDAQRMELWRGLASAAAQVDDPRHAKEFFQRIAAKDPNSVSVRYQLLMLALVTRKDADVQQALREVERVAGQDAYWHYAQALRLSWIAEGEKKSKAVAEEALNDALKHLSEAHDSYPSWSSVLTLTARINDLQHKTDWALKNFLEAVELGEHDPQAIRRTLQLLFDKQRYADADRLLRELERQQLPFADVTQVSAEVAVHQGEFRRALDIARKAAAAGPKDYQEHLWLGQILGVVGHQAKAAGQTKPAEELLAEAEQALRRAVEIEPKVVGTWIALVQFFVADEAKDKAEKVIDEVSQKIPAKQAPLAIAQCYEAMQNFDAAQKKYEVALAAAPQDPLIVRTVADFYCRTHKSALAEVQLNRIIDGKVPVPDADMFWARRELAVIVANRGGYHNFQKARELIDKNLAAAESSVLDQRVRAVINVSDPVHARHKEGIRMLETLVQDQTATAEDRYQLAQMYLAAGNWIQASIQFRDLVGSYSSEPRYLTAYVFVLLEHGEIINAELYLNRLEKISPDGIGTVVLQARMMMAKNEPNKAFELLKGFVDRPNADPPERNVRACA